MHSSHAAKVDQGISTDLEKQSSFFAMRLDVPQRNPESRLWILQKKTNEVRFEGCVLYFFGHDHGPLA